MLKHRLLFAVTKCFGPFRSLIFALVVPQFRQGVQISTISVAEIPLQCVRFTRYLGDDLAELGQRKALGILGHDFFPPFSKNWYVSRSRYRSVATHAASPAAIYSALSSPCFSSVASACLSA